MSAPRTAAQQRAYEKRGDIAALRRAAHRQALRIEARAGFEGVDIDRIHQVWRRRHLRVAA